MSKLIKNLVDTFYVSVSALKDGHDNTDGKWFYSTTNNDGKTVWVECNENIARERDGKVIFTFDWFVPVDLSNESIAECDRLYTEHFGEPTTFYDLATSPNGIKLSFNNAERKRRSPDGGGRQGIVNNVMNSSSEFYDLLMTDPVKHAKAYAEAKALSGKERLAFQKKYVLEHKA